MSRKYADPIHVRIGDTPHGGHSRDVPESNVNRPDRYGNRLGLVAQRAAALPTAGSGQPGSGPPTQFLWRGRLYVVRAILCHWLESASWWGGSRRVLEGSIPPHEQEVWRVEAQPGRSSQSGVYDLCRDSVTDQWVLTRSLD